MRSAKTVLHTASEERLSPAERVTRQIKAALERGVRPWVKPWSDTGAMPLILPRRANGIPYRGINALALWAAAEECGFASPYWFTFKQALAANAAVRKGERGSYIVFYTELPGDADAANTDDGKGDKKRILRGYTVFNASQIDGLPADYFAEATPLAPRDDDDARLTAMFAKLPITVRHGGDRAYYAMAPDVIQMPTKSTFADVTHYFATRAHESIHATRHLSRLNRDFGQKRFGDHGYALEEVTAEMGAAFIGAQIGLPADHIEDHASYVAGWLEVLTSNPNAFLTAAAKAQMAADWVLEKMEAVPANTLECAEPI
ncbi:MAG: ArdC family protein [Caulobacterales bacterium]